MADVRQFLSRYENEFCIAASTPNFWEITAANVNKGSSLLKIADMLGIKRKNVLAIGDSSNDDPMLRLPVFHLYQKTQQTVQKVLQMLLCEIIIPMPLLPRSSGWIPILANSSPPIIQNFYFV